MCILKEDKIKLKIWISKKGKIKEFFQFENDLKERIIKQIVVKS